MHHVAILRKAKIKKGDNLLGDILAGNKTIESRWYVNKVAPWDKIKASDNVFFKESGCPVTAKATVTKVLQFENLTQQKIQDIIKKYGKQIAPSITEQEFISWSKTQHNKRYCILIFLTSVQKIPAFEINKTGYGISAAWLVTQNIKKIAVP